MLSLLAKYSTREHNNIYTKRLRGKTKKSSENCDGRKSKLGKALDILAPCAWERLNGRQMHGHLSNNG